MSKSSCISCTHYVNCHLVQKGIDMINCLDYKGLISLFKTSNIDHPKHYNQNGVETIESIKSITGDKFNGYLLGNVVKYIGRFEYKNGVEDLKKAIWHLEKLIMEIEEKEIQK